MSAQIFTLPSERRLWPLAVWLALTAIWVFLMVVIGGITRLTGSGLSMVDWQPILGVIPPLSRESWQAAFDAYRQFPEYRQVNSDMTLAGFKLIFFWEYVHRLSGRLTGLVYALPLAWFWARGYLTRPLKLMFLAVLLLGGLQGLLGWYMVRSGLTGMPAVSHYRLAAHLGLALFLLASLVWILLGLLNARRPLSAFRPDRRICLALLALLAAQLLFGAFTAGLKAGLGFNTFPMMHDRWIADAVFALSPWWRNLLENPVAIQFVHRWLGVLFVISVAIWWLGAHIRPEPSGRVWLHALLAISLLQLALGTATLLFLVPVVLASLHQVFACILLMNLVAITFFAFNSGGGGR